MLNYVNIILGAQAGNLSKLLTRVSKLFVASTICVLHNYFDD